MKSIYKTDGYLCDDCGGKFKELLVMEDYNGTFVSLCPYCPFCYGNNVRAIGHIEKKEDLMKGDSDEQSDCDSD